MKIFAFENAIGNLCVLPKIFRKIRRNDLLFAVFVSVCKKLYSQRSDDIEEELSKLPIFTIQWRKFNKWQNTFITIAPIHRKHFTIRSPIM